MATILIDPVDVVSKGGFTGRIIGIDPTSHDCIIGELTTAIGTKRAEWNLSGTMRGGTPNCNLDTSQLELSELVSLLKQLGAK